MTHRASVVHVEHGMQLGRDLIETAIDVRVVHAHAARTQQSGDRTRILVAKHLPVFADAKRQLSITALLCREDLVVMRTVHRLEREYRALRIAGMSHERKHAIRVVRQMTRALVQLDPREVRCRHALEARRVQH